MSNSFHSFNSAVETKANIHTKDDNIGMNVQISLSWKFQIINDLKMFAHCGNQQHEMNTNNWVWNAQIIYSFIKRKLIAKLQGFESVALAHQYTIYDEYTGVFTFVILLIFVQIYLS